jgi:CheY-like chemotaxis protein
MPAGGQLTIATENVVFDDLYAADHPEVRPGKYVRLTISDTGVGMDASTAAHIFEPFFTTKNPGRGTGLGLATVFGIVNQAEGHVSVESAPGQGATFRIDLPAIDLEPDEAASVEAKGPAERGRETVLVVEDEPAVLRFAATLLERSGYTVLRAPTGDEAVELARHHPGQIDLLFSDMVMPGLTGRETAAAVQATRPGIRLLFASGYSEEMNASRDGRGIGDAFLSKPYAADALLRAVRASLAGN